MSVVHPLLSVVVRDLERMIRAEIERSFGELVKEFRGGKLEALLTTEQVAELLGYRSGSGVRNAIVRGELVPFGRGPRGHVFDRDSIRRFVEGRRARCSLGSVR